jgi:hypothetical protein
VARRAACDAFVNEVGLLLCMDCIVNPTSVCYDTNTATFGRYPAPGHLVWPQSHRLSLIIRGNGTPLLRATIDTS